MYHVRGVQVLSSRQKIMAFEVKMVLLDCAIYCTSYFYIETNILVANLLMYLYINKFLIKLFSNTLSLIHVILLLSSVSNKQLNFSTR